MKRTILSAASVILILIACSPTEGEKPTKSSEKPSPAVTPKAKVDPAEKGKVLFNDLGCVACHQADVKGAGPALTQIAQAYTGDESGLIFFFKGESEPRVDPAQFSVMQPQLERIQSLSPAERASLAKFVLNH